MNPLFRRTRGLVCGAALGLLCLFTSRPVAAAVIERDVVVVGGTPGGIMAAIAAARGGCQVVLLDRTKHVGGLPVNGLGATDIATRGATAGLFREFVQSNHAHYLRVYGAGSPQVRDSSDGHHFEPSVAAQTFAAMLAAQPGVETRLARQFDALPGNVLRQGARIAQIQVLNRETGATETYAAKVFIDATYEGDLAAASGAPFRLGREGEEEFREPMAGQLYKQWRGPVGPGSTGQGDNAIQAYNFRLALTDRAENHAPIARPADYRREDYAEIIEDLRLNRVTGPAAEKRLELEWDGIGRVVNMVRLPNGKTDANNQHAAFISTDLPEENWPWPTSSWDWRDRFVARQRDYTLGLLWFVQNDPGLPGDFRARCRRWSLAKDEYADNGHFPRQVYVREGRRIMGEFLFTAHDAIPVTRGGRPPVHADSITASHYPLDSHAVRKREPGRVHLDGFFSHPSEPYTVPYGVIVPRQVEGLLVPVAASATHIGFSTLRMEPCWMALGQAAGVAAGLCVRDGAQPRTVSRAKLQAELLRQKAVLMYYRDVTPEDPAFTAVQHFGLRGFLPAWEARPGQPVTGEEAAAWTRRAGLKTPPPHEAGRTTRGEFLASLLAATVAE